MGKFTFSKPAKYVPQTGAITLTRPQFITTMKATSKFFPRYKQEVNLFIAEGALNDMFSESLCKTDLTGFWSPVAARHDPTADILKFKDDAAMAMFFDMMDGFFEIEIKQLNGRRNYISGLRGKAAIGSLYAQLQVDKEPELNYYRPQPHTVRLGAPAIPEKKGDLLNQSKGLAWLTFGVRGDTNAFTQCLLRMTKFDGSFPLGPNSDSLFEAYKKLVLNPPPHRGWSQTASMQKYPSNRGGTKVLDEVLIDLAVGGMPPRGDDRWYDFALYVFASIMTVQAFTDGNKRMSRFAYVLMLLSGGVPMVVPNAGFGSRLGDML